MNIIVFQDTFTEASDTSLSSHTPDIGSGWTFTGGAGIDVIAASDHAIAVVNSNGNRTTCNNNFNTRDMTVQGTFRVPSGDPGSNFIFYGPGARASNSTVQCDEYFTYDYAAAGGSYNLGTDQFVDTAPDGSQMVLRLECKGDILTGFSDGVEKCTLTDVTSTGQFAGILLGSFAPDLTYTPVLDDFTVEVAAPTKTTPDSAFIKRPWTEQPPAGTKVNVSKPITNGLLGAWVPDIGTQTFFDALNKGRPLVPGGGANAPSISTGRFGSTYKSNSDATTGTSGDHRRFYLSEGATTENGLVLGNYDAVTVMALIRPQASAGTWGRVLTQAAGGNGAGGVELTYKTEATPYLQAYINGVTIDAGNPLQAWPYDELEMATYVIFPGQDTTDPNPKFYKGRSIAADQNSNDWTAATGNTPFCIGNWNRSDTTTSRHYNGEIYCVYLWNRELSDNERLSLVENPWQIFEPQKIMIPNTDPLQLEVY